MTLELASVWWALLLLGVAAGILSGTLGVGSGIIIVPALVMLLSFPQKSAQGTALAVMVPMAFVGALRYWLNPSIALDLRVILLVSAGAVVGAVLGSEIAGKLPGATLRRIFALFVLLVGIRMFFFPGHPGSNKPEPKRHRQSGSSLEKGSRGEKTN